MTMGQSGSRCLAFSTPSPSITCSSARDANPGKSKDNKSQSRKDSGDVVINAYEVTRKIAGRNGFNFSPYENAERLAMKVHNARVKAIPRRISQKKRTYSAFFNCASLSNHLQCGGSPRNRHRLSSASRDSWLSISR